MRLLPIFALTFGAGLASAQTITGSATVIDVHGAAEVRSGAQGAWTPIRVKQVLQPGQHLRTGTGARIESFNLVAITGGSDALCEVTVTVSEEYAGKTLKVTGSGVNIDISVAGIFSFVLCADVVKN